MQTFFGTQTAVLFGLIAWVDTPFVLSAPFTALKPHRQRLRLGSVLRSLIQTDSFGLVEFGLIALG